MSPTASPRVVRARYCAAMDTERLRRRLVTGALVLGGALAAGATWVWCRPGRATTAPDLVRQYSAAWSAGDVDAIVRMEAPDPQVPEAARRAELEEEIRARRIAYRTWTNVRYESERDHGDHLHLTVTVTGFRIDEMILVRDGDTLRLRTSETPFACSR